jgi:hypothetical protein
VLRAQFLVTPLTVQQGMFSYSPGCVQSSILTSNVGTRLQFAVHGFQFCWGFSVCPGTVLDYFPRVGWGEGWVEGSPAWCDAYLFLLKFHAGSFVASWEAEMALLFSVQHGIGRLSMG